MTSILLGDCSFVSSYYKTFVHQRGDLFKFYTSKSSSLSHSTGVQQETHSGPVDIKTFIEEHYGNVKVRLADRVIVDSQPSADGESFSDALHLMASNWLVSAQAAL